MKTKYKKRNINGNQAAEALYGKPNQATTDAKGANQHPVPKPKPKPLQAK